MPNRDSYLEGTPSWVDLATTDIDGAQAFYSALFGWEWEANETDQPDNQYHMAHLGGRAAAGLMEQSQEQVDIGLPPLWSVYLTVDDADATVAKVDAAGGSVMAPAFDVMDAGRMAVIVDPSGAVVCLWQAGEHPGCEVVNEPGSFTWAELQTPDQGACTEFFAKVVGWDSGIGEMPGLGQMTFWKVGGDDIASGMNPPMPGIPAHWQAYFAVADCDATCEQVTALGGSVVAPAMNSGPGRMAVVSDPAGGMFSVIALADPPE